MHILQSVLISLGTVLGNGSATIAADDAAPMARVEMRSGIAVFIMCEPINEYTRTTRFSTGRSSSTNVPVVGVPGVPGVGVGVGVFTGIDEQIASLARKAVRKSKHLNAFITYDCQQAQGILFAQSVPNDERVLAKATSIQGKHVYVKNTPIREYTEVEAISLKAKNMIVTPITPSDNLETVVNKMIKEAIKANKVFDALMTSDGISFLLIRYV
jgi:hypothetical protein